MKPGIKLDKGKLPWHLVPLYTLEPLLKILQFGAGKYCENGWKKVENAQERYLDACLRHIAAFQSGQLIDDESKMPHLWHALCNLYFVITLREENRTC